MPEYTWVILTGFLFMVVLFVGLGFSEYLDYKLKIKMAELGYVEVSKPTWVKV